MVIERIFKEQLIKQKPAFALAAGVFFTLTGFITSYLLFKPFVGLASILFTVILALPCLMRLFELEEAEQREETSFLTRNEALIDFYLYFFIGSFMVFFLIALVNSSLVFSIEDMQRGSAPRGYATEFAPPPPAFQQHGEIYSIFQNNFYVMIISFVLSLFYGAGSLFLITFNGSVFAATLAKVIKIKLPRDPSWYTYTFSLLGQSIVFSPAAFWSTYTFMACNLGIMFFHGIPEVLAYFFAAIAGGVLSEAFLREKFLSKGFFKISNNAFMLLSLSVIVLYIAAIIEISVSKYLFVHNVCVTNRWFVNSILLVIITSAVSFEVARKYIWKKVPQEKIQEMPQLVQYIANARAKGFSKEAVKKKLQEQGFKEAIIDFHFAAAEKKFK